MSVEGVAFLAENTRVTFELQGGLPIFREEYASPQAGKVVLKGLFNQSAHLELLDGSRYRTRQPRKVEKFPTDLVYPLVRLPSKTEVLLLRTPLKLGQGSVPRLRFSTTLDGQRYVFRQVSPGRRGFELWDGLEVQKLVNRGASSKLVPDLMVLSSVPVLLVLLLPWLDSHTITYKR
jgi:hypothetical protein